MKGNMAEIGLGATMFILRQTILSVVAQTLIYGVLLFLPAGTLSWWRAWVFLGVACVGAAATLLLVFPGREDLLRERMKPLVQEGQPMADKVAVLLFLFSYIGTIILIPLDVFRFHLTARPSSVIAAIGLALFVIGWTIISLVFKENAFAAPVVKYQPERNQTVIDTGVYRIVRHPMYSGFALLAIGMSLWLESYAATVATLIPIAILAVRITIEERFLKQELAGYEDYTQRVRYRLIPYLW
jgi:protein-S-isoprenylcysteine O-methyltransferase Ste14